MLFNSSCLLAVLLKDLPTWSYCGLSCTFDLGAYCVLKWKPIFKELTVGQLTPRFYSEAQLRRASWQVRGCPLGLAVVVGWPPELWGQLSLSCPLKGVTGGKELRLESNVEFPFLLPKAPSGLDLPLSEVRTACWDWRDTGIRDMLGMGHSGFSALSSPWLALKEYLVCFMTKRVDESEL